MERGAGLATSSAALSGSHDLVMLDLDGVVYVGPDAVPHAVDAIDAVSPPVAYLTNNATRSASDVADHLRSFGLELEGDAVVTAGQVVADLVRREVGAGARVLLAGAHGMRVALEDCGLVVVASADDEPAAVVQGGVIDVRWSELAEASFAISAGVPWFASNPDATFPTPRGLAPGNGAFVQAVELATRRLPVVAGKPSTPIFDEARRRTGATNPLMVGDRIDTDIEGAIAADVDSMIVLTGVTSLTEVLELPIGRRPSFVAVDLRGLHEPHAAVMVEGSRAVCGDAAASVDDGRLTLSAGEVDSVNGLRALVALTWHMHDRGDDVSLEDVKMGA